MDKQIVQAQGELYELKAQLRTADAKIIHLEEANLELEKTANEATKRLDAYQKVLMAKERSLVTDLKKLARNADAKLTDAKQEMIALVNEIEKRV